MLAFRRPSHYLGVCAIIVGAWAMGCARQENAPPAASPPEVFVATPTSEEFTEFEEFTGRAWAVESVDIRARVSGYLSDVLFIDGADVAVDQPLFKIDPRPYAIEAQRATALAGEASSRLARLESRLTRARRLLGEKAIAEEEFEGLQFDRDEADAARKTAEAGRAMAELNLGYTAVRAPLAGRISRRLVDKGNLIKADETLLAHLVRLDPLYVYFDVDERTVVRLREQLAAEGKTDGAVGKPVVPLSLGDRDDFSLRGELDFVDNVVDPNTGTLRMRARVANPRGLLSPGMFLRCRYPLGGAKITLFVPEEAIESDQGQSYVYVVNDNDEIVYRRIEIGPAIHGRRVVRGNLAANERIVVAGLQRVRPGLKVTPRPAPAKSAAATADMAEGSSAGGS